MKNIVQISFECTVKPVLSGHLEIDKTKVLIEKGSQQQQKENEAQH